MKEGLSARTTIVVHNNKTLKRGYVLNKGNPTSDLVRVVHISVSDTSMVVSHP